MDLLHSSHGKCSKECYNWQWNVIFDNRWTWFLYFKWRLLTQHIQESLQVTPGPLPDFWPGPGDESKGREAPRVLLPTFKWPSSEINPMLTLDNTVQYTLYRLLFFLGTCMQTTWASKSANIPSRNYTLELPSPSWHIGDHVASYPGHMGELFLNDLGTGLDIVDVLVAFFHASSSFPSALPLYVGRAWEWRPQ